MENFESLESRFRIPDLVADSVTAQQTGQLPAGIYSVMNVSDADARIKVGTTANDVTQTSGRRIFAGNEVFQEVKKDRRIGLIAVAGTATLEIHLVRSIP